MGKGMLRPDISRVGGEAPSNRGRWLWGCGLTRDMQGRHELGGSIYGVVWTGGIVPMVGLQISFYTPTHKL